MYVVDITRDNNKTDMLCGNDSMDAKSKTLNYIMDYTFANYNIYLNKDVLDQNLNMDLFSLKHFLNDNYSVSIDNDLIIQSIPTDKKHCLFLKYMDEKKDIPDIYVFGKNDFKIAQSFMKYLVNDALIDKYQDNLEEYDRLKLELNKNYNLTATHYPKLNIKSEIVSLYNGGMFLEELLNNACSLKQLNKDEFGGINI